MVSVGLLALVLGACALVRSKHEVPTTILGPAERVVRHVAQVDFGRQARFATCVESECPSRTPKTMMAWVSPTPASVPDSARIGPAAPAPVALSSSRELPMQPVDKHSTLLFALGSATLSEGHKVQLRVLLDGLRRSERVTVSGRTDDLGSRAANQSLALARGLAVRDYLLELDPQLPARIAIDARGRCCYAAPNDDERSRSRNRRVEISYSTTDSDAP